MSAGFHPTGVPGPAVAATIRARTTIMTPTTIMARTTPTVRSWRVGSVPLDLPGRDAVAAPLPLFDLKHPGKDA
jgi:hypothetical protein